MESRLEQEAVKELEQLFFQEGLYYATDPQRKDYKKHRPLYKCLYSSEYGALLRAFNEEGKTVGEHFVPHGAKRYILSDQNEESIRKAHYESFISGLQEKANEHQALADKLVKEVEAAKAHFATWK